jgi:hypothetical protein
MEVPTELYTTSSLFTLGGSVSAVWIVMSVLSNVFGPQKIKKLKKLLGLILSVGIAILGAAFLEEQTFLTWVVAVFNGLLIYMTAFGINAGVSGRPVKEEAPKPVTRGLRGAGKKAVTIFRNKW